MPYRRKNRPSWYTDFRLEDGWWKGVCLPVAATTDGKRIAKAIEALWDTLAREHRAYDILNAVKAGRWTIGRLYDEWQRATGDNVEKVAHLRQRLNDVDLATLRGPFLAVYDKQVRSAETRARMRRHLNFLFGPVEPTEDDPAHPLLASEATAEELTERLYEYEAGGNTLRVVHANWSVFFDYARLVRQVIKHDPMDLVARPPTTKPPIEFYELETIERIIAWQPTPKRRALFSLLYGTPIEISVALGITRADINPATREVRAPGTKAHSRDRVVRVDDWAWDAFWSYARDMLPLARIFGDTNRWTASDWHRETIGTGTRETQRTEERAGLELPKRYKMYASRHAWIVRFLRAGGPIALAQYAAGHATAKETFDTYGRFVTNEADRAYWQGVVAKAEERRRSSLLLADPQAMTGA